MYKEEKFSIRSVEEIKGDIDAIAAVRDDLRAISMARGQGGGVTREAVLELIRNAPELNFSHGIGMVLDWLHSGGKTAFLQDANSPVMKNGKPDGNPHLPSNHISIIGSGDLLCALQDDCEKKPGRLESHK